MNLRLINQTAVLCGGFLVLSPSLDAKLTYTTGLHVWLDASDIDGSGNSTLNDFDEVLVWKNKGTTGVGDALAILAGGGESGGSKPGIFVRQGGLGSQDAVQLDNARYQFGQEFMDSPSFTAYFVVQRAEGSSVGTVFNDYGTVGLQLCIISTNDSGKGGFVSQVRDLEADLVTAVSPALAADTWATLFASMDGATKTASVGLVGGEISSATNDSYDPTTTWDGTAAPPTVFGFNDGNNSHDFNGFASEVLIFDHILDASARAEVERYLAAKVNPVPEVSLEITEIGFDADGKVALTVEGLDPSASYVLKRSGNLEDGFPETAFGPWVPESETETITDTDPPAGQAFYRLEEAP